MNIQEILDHFQVEERVDPVSKKNILTFRISVNVASPPKLHSPEDTAKIRKELIDTLRYGIDEMEHVIHVGQRILDYER
jgi:hypothetical protein